jgi:serine phosphatase RsbU (regulator of sigma subunit)
MMVRQKLKIRKIIFGIRFKFSAIIILTVLFVSALIGFTLVNQQEEKLRNSLRHQGATILTGIEDQAQVVLRANHFLSAPQKTPVSPVINRYLRNAQTDSLKKIGEYFSSIIGKNVVKNIDTARLLDIAFIVDINWKDINTDWKKSDQAKYYYFDRITGVPFIQKNGLDDPLLKPSIVNHYMSTVDIKPYIGFTNIKDVDEQYKYKFKDRPDFVIVGIPIFNEKTDLYKRYLQFKQGSILKNTHQRQLETKKTQNSNTTPASPLSSLQQYLSDRNELPQEFIKRIINNGLNFDYIVELRTLKQFDIVANFLMNMSAISRINQTDRKELYKIFRTSIQGKIVKGHITSADIRNIWIAVNKRYRLVMQPDIIGTKFNHDCYYYLSRFNIPITSDKSIDELALISYKKDIAGILGLFIFREQYFPELRANRNFIFNLMISILLRAIFLALLFPTFIIRSIKKLADGALIIGKGDFNKTIEIPGTDEIGRLADILNIMTVNLKKAQEMKIEKIRMERELITAQQIQSALLPEILPQSKGIEFGAYYSAQTESGGDYYDFINLDEGRLGITIADVSGHGVGSGLVMAMTRTLLHIYCRKTTNTKKIFEMINEYLKENTASNYFVTMFYGILNPDSLKLTYSSAGHCQPLLIRNGKIKELPAGGIALGATNNIMFSNLTEVKEIQLQKGDYFIQYTDGVDEAMNSDSQEYGVERFKNALIANYNKSPQELIQSVVNDISSFTGNIPQHDDITLIAFAIR